MEVKVHLFLAELEFADVEYNVVFGTCFKVLVGVIEGLFYAVVVK